MLSLNCYTIRYKLNVNKKLKMSLKMILFSIAFPFRTL